MTMIYECISLLINLLEEKIIDNVNYQKNFCIIYIILIN